MASKLLSFDIILLLLSFQLRLSLSDDSESMQSVPDLQRAMYTVVDGYPCVRLLNLSGEIGCANPGRDRIVAPVVVFKNDGKLVHRSAVLVSFDKFQQLFDRISNDPSFAKNVAGVLVDSRDDTQNRLTGFSPAEKFPEVEFAPYENKTYEWNPMGSGVMWKAYNFPVFLLSKDGSQIVQEVALKNEKKDAFTGNVVEFDLVMQTTKSGIHDSESCLRDGACLPLGGYSVWSSLPPINISQSSQSKPVILTVASLDSASFFRDKSLGAESPVSGLISLLAVVDALSRVDGLGDLSNQLAFSVFTGEAWGYLGSRRFLHELDLQSEAVAGLSDSHIEMVIEIGSVGKAFIGGNKAFFTHTARESAATTKMWNAFKRAQGSLESQNVTVTMASTSNPGIPPSSLMSFLRKRVYHNASTPGIILEDFDAAFINKFYHSHLDDISNVNSSAIVAAASLVARSLYILASGTKNLSESDLSAINVNATLVEELIGCLLACDPGLSCELVKSYIAPTATCPSHYVGVIIGEPSSNPYSGYVDDISRFIWNFLSDKTSISKGNNRSSCSNDCGKNGGVCIKAETDNKGVCVVSTTRYVPAYSTRLKYDTGSGAWTVLPSNVSDPMGMVDPVWTESNWDAIGLRVYKIQDSTFDNLVLVGGISVTVLAYVAIVITRAFVSKALKRD